MIKGIIFDLDGVIVSTDEFHYQAWKELADEENIYFDKIINNRLRGVSRMESLEIILERSQKKYSVSEKQIMAERKNTSYAKLITKLSPKDILKGSMELLERLRKADKKLAVGSSSKNCKNILKYIGLDNYFDAVVDGTMIFRSKPDSEVFLKAAKLLNLPANQCLVVEDADAGIMAAINAKMFTLAVGAAAKSSKADIKADNLSLLDIESFLAFCNR